MNRDLHYYLGLNYPYTIEEEDEDGEKTYVAEIPDLPGCGAQGRSLDEARESLGDAQTLWIEESLKRGLPIPEPSNDHASAG